jgi:hypothetical protein
MAAHAPEGQRETVNDGSFTLDGYRSLLRRTAETYEMADFHVLGDPDLARKKLCILRHDIDISPRRALETARIEAELGVRSTYTVLMTGRFYNPLERDVRDLLLEIVALGHHIGLHFDAAWHGVDTEEKLAAGLAWEVETLGNVLSGVPIEMFSFHDPSDVAMGFQETQYQGLWNAYSAVQRQAFSYLSDSNGYWRFRSWQQALDEHPERLHVLIHSEWWIDRYLPPAERISTAIDERSIYMWQKYCAGLVATHRENKSDVPQVLEILPRILGGEGDRLVQHWLSGERAGALLNLLLEVRSRSGGESPSAEEEAARGVLSGLADGRTDIQSPALREAFTGLAVRLAQIAEPR